MYTETFIFSFFSCISIHGERYKKYLYLSYLRNKCCSSDILEINIHKAIPRLFAYMEKDTKNICIYLILEINLLVIFTLPNFKEDIVVVIKMLESVGSQHYLVYFCNYCVVSCVPSDMYSKRQRHVRKPHISLPHSPPSGCFTNYLHY